MAEDIWRALALVLIIEGLLPALTPLAWREAMARIINSDPRSIRLVGIGSMVVGAVVFRLVTG
jgi:uncharacterized protein YjeT (DUF2065 family)